MKIATEPPKLPLVAHKEAQAFDGFCKSIIILLSPNGSYRHNAEILQASVGCG